MGWKDPPIRDKHETSCFFEPAWRLRTLPCAKLFQACSKANAAPYIVSKAANPAFYPEERAQARLGMEILLKCPSHAKIQG
jgi:hypothetical protein